MLGGDLGCYQKVFFPSIFPLFWSTYLHSADGLSCIIPLWFSFCITPLLSPGYLSTDSVRAPHPTFFVFVFCLSFLLMQCVTILHTCSLQLPPHFSSVLSISFSAWSVSLFQGKPAPCSCCLYFSSVVLSISLSIWSVSSFGES